MSTLAESTAGRVLVADEEVQLSGILAEWLQQSGYSVVCATTADEAFERHRKNRFDIILLDWSIGGVGGGDSLLRRIKKLNGNKCKIVLMLDGSASLHLETRVSGFLMKPFTIADLQKTLAAVSSPQE
jgi:DNA-binding response OmpR family regulator